LVHLTRRHGSAALEDAIRECRLAMVDVRDDREVAYELGVGHGEFNVSKFKIQDSITFAALWSLEFGIWNQLPSGHRDRALADAASLAPSRRYRSQPAQAIIAALSVVRARSGRSTGTPRWSPQAKARARSSEFAATPPERARRSIPSARS